MIIIAALESCQTTVKVTLNPSTRSSKTLFNHLLTQLATSTTATYISHFNKILSFHNLNPIIDNFHPKPFPWTLLRCRIKVQTKNLINPSKCHKSQSFCNHLNNGTSTIRVISRRLLLSRNSIFNLLLRSA